MQLRCTYCQTMFAIGRDEKLVALQAMSTENLLHYDAFCPKCRRANRIDRKRMELSFPGWQKAYEELVKQSADAEKSHAKAAEQIVTKTGKTLEVNKAKPAKAKKSAEVKQKTSSAKTKKVPGTKVKPASGTTKKGTVERKKKVATVVQKK